MRFRVLCPKEQSDRPLFIGLSPDLDGSFTFFTPHFHKQGLNLVRCKPKRDTKENFYECIPDPHFSPFLFAGCRPYGPGRGLGRLRQHSPEHRPIGVRPGVFAGRCRKGRIYRKRHHPQPGKCIRLHRGGHGPHHCGGRHLCGVRQLCRRQHSDQERYRGRDPGAERPDPHQHHHRSAGLRKILRCDPGGSGGNREYADRWGSQQQGQCQRQRGCRKCGGQVQGWLPGGAVWHRHPEPPRRRQKRHQVRHHGGGPGCIPDHPGTDAEH